MEAVKVEAEEKAEEEAKAEEESIDGAARREIGGDRLGLYVWDYAMDAGSGYDKERPGRGAVMFLTDVCSQGCSSGCWSDLIYYSDTGPFFQKYAKEIGGIVREDQESGAFGDKGMSSLTGWDSSDPLALEENNRNVLAWYGVESWAMRLTYACSRYEHAGADSDVR